MSQTPTTIIKMTKNELYQTAIDSYNMPMQVIVAIEEASEFQKELTKVLRSGIGEISFVNLCEEIADLEIMIEQIKFGYKLDKDVENYKKYKLNRLAERLNCRSEFNA